MKRNSHETQARVAVLTGASAGVGRATARELAGRGYKIGLIARGRPALYETRREVEDLGGEAVVVPTDVADPDQVDSAADYVEGALGPIDLWINDAIVTVMSPISEMTAEEFRRVTEVNYLGYVHGTLAALRRMRRRDRGQIVQVSSALAFRGIPLQSAYCATKAAIVRFTESLRTELMHDGSGIHVTMVHLPALNTPQFEWSRSRMDRKPQPVPPIFEPEVAAEAIAWAAEHHRRDVMVGGSTVMTILGNKVAPGVADRYLARKGYEAQLTNRPRDPNRPDNLFSPVWLNQGARGPYSSRSKPRSGQLWLTTHRKILAAAGAGTLLALGALFVSHRRRAKP